MPNTTLMMDANARYAACKVIKKEDLTPQTFLKEIENNEDILKKYQKEVTNTYIENAKWSALFGQALFKETEKPIDLVVFVYNIDNKKREHWNHIENAITEAGEYVIKKLEPHAELYACGVDKKHWMRKFPQLKKLDEPEASNRAIFFYGYQQEIGEDPDVHKLRDVDYFIRASQLRYSGMYFPALKNACFIILTHPPLLYDPGELAQTLVQTKKTDVEHNKINIYEDPTIYEEWLDILEQNPRVIITTLSRPPKMVELNNRFI